MKKNLKYYLGLNYPVTIETYLEDEQLRYSLEIPDLPGCGADGETIDEAMEKLQDAKELWIHASLKRKLPIPEPVSEDDFSGKFLLRIPTRLHMALAKQAKKEGQSLNQYVRSVLEGHMVWTSAGEIWMTEKAALLYSGGDLTARTSNANTGAYFDLTFPKPEEQLRAQAAGGTI